MRAISLDGVPVIAVEPAVEVKRIDKIDYGISFAVDAEEFVSAVNAADVSLEQLGASMAKVVENMITTALVSPPVVQSTTEKYQDSISPRDTCLADTLAACQMFRPIDSDLIKCKCGNLRSRHNKTQIDKWMASISMILSSRRR